MDFYHYADDDHYGWGEELIAEHYEIEKNDPMTAELEHFADLCTGREANLVALVKTALQRSKLSMLFLNQQRRVKLLISNKL